MQPAEVRNDILKKNAETHPSGCCNKETRSSTAVEAAMEARPGLVTVHIWSSVRSVRDFKKRYVSKSRYEDRTTIHPQGRQYHCNNSNPVDFPSI